MKGVAQLHESIVKDLGDATSSLGANRALDDSMDPRWTVVEPANAGSRMESYNQSLIQMSSFISSTILLAVAEDDPSVVGFGTRDSATMEANGPEYLVALNESLSLRQVDVVTSFRRGQLIVGVVGLGCFVLALAVSAVLFSRAIASLRERSARVVQLMFYMPQRVAKALRKHAAGRLSRTANKLDDDGAIDDESAHQDFVQEDLEATINATLAPAETSSNSQGG